ncbi:MAG: hypothetical protein ABS904_00635 [Solibacillus isronensis]
MNVLLALTKEELMTNINRIANFCYMLDPYGTRYAGKKLKIAPTIKMFVLSEQPESFDMVERIISKECSRVVNYSYFGETKSPSMFNKDEMKTLVSSGDTIIITNNNSLPDYHCQQALNYYKDLGVKEVNLDLQNLISACFSLQMKPKNEVS